MSLSDKVLSNFGVLILLMIASLPILWPVFATWEGKYFPVVGNASIDSVRSIPNQDTYETEIYMSFIKYRNCEFVGINWYLLDGSRIPIVFSSRDQSSRTRSTGAQRKAGPWLMYGVKDVNATYATVVHKCHPLWLTTTEFFVASDSKVSHQ